MFAPFSQVTRNKKLNIIDVYNDIYEKRLSDKAMLGQCTSILILHGGYNLKSLSEGVAVALRPLLGNPCPCLNPTTGNKQNVNKKH